MLAADAPASSRDRPCWRSSPRRARSTLWELAVLCAAYGVGTAFFNPAFDAVVPDILPADQLAAANSLDQFVRPLALRLAGPAAAGGHRVVGLGMAFAVDALASASPLPR